MSGYQHLEQWGGVVVKWLKGALEKDFEFLKVIVFKIHYKEQQIVRKI